MARAGRLVRRSSGVRWGQSEERQHPPLPVTYGLPVLVNAALATPALMRKALSDSRVAVLSLSYSHGMP